MFKLRKEITTITLILIFFALVFSTTIYLEGISVYKILASGFNANLKVTDNLGNFTEDFKEMTRVKYKVKNTKESSYVKTIKEDINYLKRNKNKIDLTEEIIELTRMLEAYKEDKRLVVNGVHIFEADATEYINMLETMIYNRQVFLEEDSVTGKLNNEKYFTISGHLEERKISYELTEKNKSDNLVEVISIIQKLDSKAFEGLEVFISPYKQKDIESYFAIYEDMILVSIPNHVVVDNKLEPREDMKDYIKRVFIHELGHHYYNYVFEEKLEYERLCKENHIEVEETRPWADSIEENFAEDFASLLLDKYYNLEMEKTTNYYYPEGFEDLIEDF